MTSIARRRLVLSDSDSDSDRDIDRDTTRAVAVAVEQEKATMAQVASLLTSKLPPSLVESVDLNAELAALRNNNATTKNSDDEAPLFSDASDSDSHSEDVSVSVSGLKQRNQRNQATSDSASVPFRRKDVLAALGLENKDLDLDDSEDSDHESEGDDGVADGDEDGGSNNNDDDDDEAFDSDGNRIDDDGVITNSNSKAKRKVLEETQERVVSQIKVGKRGASKKALLEMRKQSERLQRATHIELPARRGNLDINSFLSLYNIKRPEEKKRAWGEPENEDSDDADDPDYNPNQAISDEVWFEE
ncbi:hypothetical protein HDU99_005485 [Rhizoclosmatium hyalinum]|nr:hypothetical protein HDU99_005485 [Rhizoclosmatium hyalinum]